MQEQRKASVRAKVEHPFRVIKRQFELMRVRFRGLTKNTAHVLTPYANGRGNAERGELHSLNRVGPIAQLPRSTSSMGSRWRVFRATLDGHHATVDEEFMPRHETRSIRGQEQYCVGDLTRFAESAERDHLLQGVLSAGVAF